ncbi:type I-E CRISPR-associated protein Cas5/CasD [Actinacidiphila sp. bgisy167]|uniref:type I-E CRISPR-associated protein Cas5/CasD n=1 Tax=Actinacidiphila sp. bgisy167 TaxID=3413797 RepID=UPI003D744680
MSVLTLRLAGPLQSWGSAGRFARRSTGNAPTKSGVIGLLGAAVGLDRDDDTGLAELARLRFGVRIDQPGTRLRDFQTAHHFDTGEAMPLSERHYLADAVFIAAVQGPAALIERLHTALRTPRYLPYLGRRSCPPSQPVDLGVHHDAADLHTVLAAEPWHAADWHQKRHRHQSRIDLTAHLEAPTTGAEQHPGADTLGDQPLSYDPRHRRYALRPVRTATITVTNPHAHPGTAASAPAHDPIGHLEGA